MAALSAAAQGARVLVLEKSSLIGGTTAISGGQVWIPSNRHLSARSADSTTEAKAYLCAVTLNEVDEDLIDAFLQMGPLTIECIEALTPLRFFQLQRPDYHSSWVGAKVGRSLEPEPLSLGRMGPVAVRVRRSPHRPPLTSVEIRAGQTTDLVAERRRNECVTQGVALVAGLLQGCLDLGVQVRCNSKVDGLIRVAPTSTEVLVHGLDQGKWSCHASSAVIASGGFEWNQRLKNAFLGCVDEGAASPPWNEGDGLRIGLAAGAAVAQMTQSWLSAAFSVPGETYDGEPLVRNIVRELALPGSILVNADGKRFANEASSYNAIGKAFQIFDAALNRYVNKRAWLVFDEAFKRRYTVATVAASAEVPPWFFRGDSPQTLAQRAGIDADGLVATLERFSQMARKGVDSEFGRGDTAHDRYSGDESRAHPNLGEITTPPFYAVPIFLGNLGTKGGLVTDRDGQVRDMDDAPIPGLFACGNAAASWMGPGYPGAGGSLGPTLTAAHLCGIAAARSAGVAPQGVDDGKR
jgi:3-oxosteroid 1-dehydrogenase